MGRYLKSSEVFNLKGSVSGVTFSNNASGGIIRLKTKNTNRKTLKQSQNRNSFAQSNGGWHTLTDEQKMLWNRAGSARKNSGLNEFISYNKLISNVISKQINITNNFYSINGTILGGQTRGPFSLVKNPPNEGNYFYFSTNQYVLNLEGISRDANWGIAFEFSPVWVGKSPENFQRNFLRSGTNNFSGIYISGMNLGAQLSSSIDDNWQILWFSGIQSTGNTFAFIPTSIKIGIRTGNTQYLDDFLKPGTHNYRFKISRIFQNGKNYDLATKDITISI